MFHFFYVCMIYTGGIHLRKGKQNILWGLKGGGRGGGGGGGGTQPR